MIVHAQSPRRDPAPVNDGPEGSVTALTSVQGRPGAASSPWIALQIPFEQRDPKDSETLKQLALHIMGIGTVVIRSAFEKSGESNVAGSTNLPRSDSDVAEF